MATFDKVKVFTKDETFEGILMPSSKDKVVLKLNSGYNLGIEKKKVKSIKIMEKAKMKKQSLNKIKYNSKLHNISILHTGGTIASKVDYETGAVSPEFNPEDILNMYPELTSIANIHSRLISNIFSEDMSFKDYNLMVKEVEKEVKRGVKGIIITHGTDTLHYSSSALSFMLENLPIPVIFVGSQRSSDRGSSDAFLNLLCAIQFILQTNYPGVGICMHSSMDDKTCFILPGLKTRKFHTSRRDAFKVVNSSIIAEIDKEGNLISGKTDYDLPKNKLKVKLIKENLKIGVLKSHPNMSPKELSSYSTFDGLILEGTGLGHLPINKNKLILPEIKKLSKKMPLVMTSQTIFGRVNLNVYSTGRELKEYVLSGEDMLTETAFIKLAFLLSNYNKKEIPELIGINLKGEINERLGDEFL